MGIPFPQISHSANSQMERVSPLTNESNITYHGSRFGTGIKQLKLVDNSNHIIMDCLIHDAIEESFNHVVIHYP